MEDLAKWLQAECERANASYVSPEEAHRQRIEALRKVVAQRTISAYEFSKVRVAIAERRPAPPVVRVPSHETQRLPRRRSVATVRTAPTRGPPDDEGESEPPDPAPRCSACGAYVSPYCTICLGSPDDGVSVEELARGVAQVDRATRRWRLS
jgi:hypothetical protein